MNVCEFCHEDRDGYITHAEYIKREVAVKAANEWVSEACVAPVMRVSRLFDKLQKVPAADVAQVVRGRWEHLGGDEWCCSACGFVLTTEGSWDKPTKKYCEDCGAKMDGGADREAD